MIETALTDENIPHAERLLEAERRIKDFNHLYFKGAEATRHSIDGLTCHIVADEGNYKLWYEETHSTQRFYLTTKDGQPAFVK